MSLTKIGKEQQEHGNWHIYNTKSFDPDDPLSELEALYKPKKETPKKVKSEKEKKIEELNKLNRQLLETDNKFEKAKGIRFTITTLAFAAFYFVILMLLGGKDISFVVEAVVNADIMKIVGMVFAPIFLSVIHVLLNASIFGHLSAKGREENEILESIRKRIRELEKAIGD